MGKLKLEMAENFPGLFMSGYSDPYILIALTIMKEKDFSLDINTNEWLVEKISGLSEKESNDWFIFHG